MSRIAVVYAPLGYGGGECVCFNVLEALQEDHDVTFVTDKRPDVADRNRYYGTAVDPARLTVRRAPAPIPHLLNLSPHRFWRFKQQLFNRYLQRIETEYDLVVSTIDEYDISGHSIQYIHFPKYLRSAPGTVGEGRLVYAIYDRLCDLLVPVSADPLANATVLTNSNWTRRIVEEGYGVNARVVYPPVDVDNYEPIPWADRENGIVTVGRLSPEKRLLELIDVTATLVDRGHDLHHHIVGPRDNSAYADRVWRKAADLPFVHVEGAVSKRRLATLLSIHRYGLHGMRHEHFGIGLAEMVAAGMLPVAHASGGPREILASAPALLYRDLDDAVDVLDAMLSSDERQRELRDCLTDTTVRFDVGRFKREIRAITAETVGELRGSVDPS